MRSPRRGRRPAERQRPQPFGPSWQGLIDQPDRAAALGCFRAATLMALKRALRNHSISVDHSLSHRVPEDKLIPLKLWQRDRGRFIRDLNLPASAEKYLQRLEAGLTAGLAALAEAVEAGAVAIDGDELRLPRRKPEPKDPRLEPARQAFARAIGDVQLPDVLIEIDAPDPVLLDPARPPGALGAGIGDALCRSDRPRLRSLGGRIGAHGAARWRPTASARWCSGSKRTAGCARPMMRCCASCASIRVAILWGRGLFASADMMSLEATRYLWSARLDPRRRTYAVGTYAHVLDQWGILYDQPIVLNRRQVGAAIEGALRQRQVDAARTRRGRHAWLYAFRDGARQDRRVRSVPAVGRPEETKALSAERA